MKDFLNYLRYSGLVVSFTVNPFHWNYIPRYFRNTEWRNDCEYGISFLFLTIRIWIDDGSW